VLGHIGELPEDVQVELAEQIEQFHTAPEQKTQRTRSFAGIWRDLPDDMEDTPPQPVTART